jgi:rSAM/selenodomain-associated transferase 2
MKTSVIIPVLNERQTLPATVKALRACEKLEIIVADGGSTDGTLEWLRSQPDVVVISAPRGKGPQINAGAAAAKYDLLLFLHADCVLGQSAFNAMQSAASDPRVAGGAFCVRFVEVRPRSLHVVAAGINLRARIRRSATGDQGIFVRKDVFSFIGGAPDWPLFEDVELVRRIKRKGKFAVVREPLTISPRRYLVYGVWRTVFLVYALRLGYWLGVSPQRLKQCFQDMRPAHPGESH